jgi:hypothetical protein
MRTRWYFALALVLFVLAVTILPTPFSGIAAMGCVAAFIAGGARHLKGSDPEMVKKVTRGGIPGGGF